MRIKERTVDVNGHSFVLRNAEVQDAEMLLEYLRQVSGETRFLVRDAEEPLMSLEMEQAYIEQVNASKKSVMILAFLDGEYVGNASYSVSGLSRLSHRGDVGIALFLKYTGMGLGQILLESLIDIAEESGLEQLELEASSENIRAISLYKKLGFKTVGVIKHGMKYRDGSYTDLVLMQKMLGNQEAV